MVGTAVGGIPEIVDPNKNGIFTNRDPDQIAVVISRELKKSWNEHTITKSVVAYNWESVSNDVFNVFCKALAIGN